MSEIHSSYYKLLFEKAPDGVFLTDLITTFLELNESACHIFDCDVIQKKGGRLADYVYNSDQDKMKESIEELMKNGIIQCHNWRITTPGGKCKYYELSASLLPDEKIVWHFRDFSQLRSKLDDLYLSEKKFRSILERTKYSSIMLLNSSGIIEFANQKTLSMFGYEEEELVGEPLEILLPEKIHKDFRAQRFRIFSEEAVRSSESGIDISGVKKNGIEFPIDITLTSFHTEKGYIITCIIRDLSDRKRYEAQQKFLSDQSRVLVENFDSDILLKQIAHLMVPFLCDFNALYIQENNKLRFKESVPSAGISGKVLEYVCSHFFSEPEIIPYDYSQENIHQVPLHFELITDQLLAALTINENHLRQAKMLSIKELLLIPLVARSKMLGLVMFGMSVSGRKFTRSDIEFADEVTRRFSIAIDNNILYQKAQRAVKSRQEILAVVSHDLKNPLTVIKSTFQVIAQLMNNNKEQESIGKLTDNVQKSIFMMERMIEDLLDVEKIEAGTFSIRKSMNSVDRMITDLMDIFKYPSLEKKIKLSYNLAAPDIYVSCDRTRVMQVLSNLVNNAIKFTDPGGTVDVTVKADDGKVEFCIKDSGRGMNEEEVSNLFQRFWQSRKTAHLGTGLGLYISRSIIEAHHGKIYARSQTGNGSEFYFELPKKLPIATQENENDKK